MTKKSTAFVLQVKSALASAFTAQGIKVEHSGHVKTASYDKNRKRILLPNWSDISNDLYDTLSGQATAHAIWTPNGQVSSNHKAIETVCSEDTDTGELYLNVVESARVEKLMCDRHWGYRGKFLRGNKELLEQADDFEYDIDAINAGSLIDKFNFRSKFSDPAITFTPEEQVLVDKANKTYSWVDSVKSAKAMLDYDVERNQQSKGQGDGDGDPQDGDQQGEGQGGGQPQQGQGDSQGQPQQGDQDGDQDGDSQGQGQPHQGDGQGSGQGDPQDGDQQGEGQGSSQGGGNPYDGLGSMSKQMEDSKSELETSPESPRYDYSNNGVDTSKDGNGKDMDGNGGFKSNDLTYNSKIGQCADLIYDGLAGAEFPDSKLRGQKIAAKFALALNAKIEEKTKVHKTGTLNMDVLHEYKWNDEIFLTEESVPEGKSHGVTIMVDCSGSMGHVIGKVFIQLHDLISFCKVVDIPFRVYGFTSGSYQVNEIIRSDYTRAKYNECMERIHHVMTYGSSGIRMNGTPLIQALDIIKSTNHMFIKACDFDVHNMFILTDGEGSSWGNYIGSGAIIENGKMYAQATDSWGGSFLACDFMKNLHPNTNVSWFHISSRDYNFEQYGLKLDASHGSMDVYVGENTSPDVLFHFKDDASFTSHHEIFAERLVRNMKSRDKLFA